MDEEMYEQLLHGFAYHSTVERVFNSENKEVRLLMDRDICTEGAGALTAAPWMQRMSSHRADFYPLCEKLHGGE